MYLWTYEQDDNCGYLPVELALKKYKDDTAAYLISQMRHDRWVQLWYTELLKLSKKKIFVQDLIIIASDH